MIKLHKALQKDFNYLYKLKKETLKEYIAKIWDWDEGWQKDYFSKNFKPELVKIITKAGKDIGCISILEEEDLYFLSIIELSPNYQNKGIGTQLIKDLILKANRSNKCIKLQVLKVNNNAQRLYTSLGFSIKDESETHVQMIYKK